MISTDIQHAVDRLRQLADNGHLDVARFKAGLRIIRSLADDVAELERSTGPGLLRAEDFRDRAHLYPVDNVVAPPPDYWGGRS